MKVDFIVREDEAYRREEFRRRRRVTIDGWPLSLVSPEDLILSRLMWAKAGSSAEMETTPDVETRLAELFRRRSGSDRVVMACGMFDCARALIESNIRTAAPDITETELRVRMLSRLYGEDVSVERLDRIARRLRSRGSA